MNAVSLDPKFTPAMRFWIAGPAAFRRLAFSESRPAHGQEIRKAVAPPTAVPHPGLTRTVGAASQLSQRFDMPVFY
jgi:hypothetical protein